MIHWLYHMEIVKDVLVIQMEHCKQMMEHQIVIPTQEIVIAKKMLLDVIVIHVNLVTITFNLAMVVVVVIVIRLEVIIHHAMLILDNVIVSRELQGK